ncbi:MAG: DUF952 domain-containing protein [Alphaproteobacteria bacterium]|nr:DUF952 domain-containing protein [Alphaproteobacteria bacterium]
MAEPHHTDTRVYKIFRPDEWAQTRRLGFFAGSADDRRDGFIHLSRGSQVAGTLARHFAGAGPLVLAAVEARALGPGLRYEPARGGTLFPHLYGVLPRAAVCRVFDLAPDAAGGYRLPADLLPADDHTTGKISAHGPDA